MIRTYFGAGLVNLGGYLSDRDLEWLTDGLTEGQSWQEIGQGYEDRCDLAYGAAVLSGMYFHDRPTLVSDYLGETELVLLSYAIAYLCAYPQRLEGLLPYLHRVVSHPELELVGDLVAECQPLTVARQCLDPEGLPFCLYLFLSCPDLVSVGRKRAGTAVLPVSALLSLHAPQCFGRGSSSSLQLLGDRLFQSWAGMLTPPRPFMLIV